MSFGGGGGGGQQPAPYNAQQAGQAAGAFSGFGGGGTSMFGGLPQMAGMQHPQAQTPADGGLPPGVGGAFSFGPPPPYSGQVPSSGPGSTLQKSPWADMGGTPSVASGKTWDTMSPQEKADAYNAGVGKNVFGQTTGAQMHADSPDAWFTAAERTAQSGQQQVAQQTAANRPNTTNAYGSQQQWTQAPDGSWQLSQGFGGALGQANQNLQQQWLQNSSTPLDNGSAARDQAINAAYGQATSRLDPRFNQQQDSLNVQLANQGLSPGSQAFRQAQQQFGQQRNDAYTSAMNSAIGQGTAAQQATFGQNLMARQYPLQALQGMGQFLQNPNFNPAGAGPGVNYSGALEGYGNYQNGVASNNAQTAGAIGGGMGALGLAILGAL